MEQNELLIPKQQIRRVKPIQIAKPKRLDTQAEIWRKKAAYAEETGMGDLLCIEGFFGRPFRSDRQYVEEILCEYCDMYANMCERFDSDPGNPNNYEVICWNDLYSMLNLIPSMAGDSYGYVNSDDYRVEMDFETKMVDQGEWVDCFKEPFFYFTPKPSCYPDPCYREY